MPSAKKSKTKSKSNPSLRQTGFGVQSLPTLHASFVIEEGLTLSHVFDAACEDALIVVDTDRLDTAAGSMSKFHDVLTMLQTPGKVVEGWPTPLKGGLLRMNNVGVVVRDAQGERVWPPPRTLPTLYAPVNNHGMYAAIGPDVVARLCVDVNS